MNLKSTLQTTGFVALLAFAAPAIALAQSASPATTGHSPAQTGSQKQLVPPPEAQTQTKMSQQPQAPMSETKLESMLKSQGYSDITNMNKTGSYYTADATRYGKQVKGLQINPMTGQVMNQQELSQDQVKTLLENNGYSNVTDIKHSGHEYTANVMRNGTKISNLKIDDHTGMIMRQQAQQ